MRHSCISASSLALFAASLRLLLVVYGAGLVLRNTDNDRRANINWPDNASRDTQSLYLDRKRERERERAAALISFDRDRRPLACYILTTGTCVSMRYGEHGFTPVRNGQPEMASSSSYGFVC